MAYEGTAYPETEGWIRFAQDENGNPGDGAVRTISDGVLTLDGTSSILIYDYYERSDPIVLNQDERFRCEWRLAVTQSTRPDAGVTINFSDGYILGLNFTSDRVTSAFEDWSLPITVAGYHDYVIESADQRTYALYMDGALVRSGSFWDGVLSRTFFAFGDGAFGGNLLTSSSWDYARFGVVPEPSNCVSLLIGLGAYRWRTS